MPGNYYAGKMRELRDKRGGKCERCGATESEAKRFYANGLEFAHLVTTTVNGRGRGRANRYHDIKNNPSSYALLCRRCHRDQEGKGGARLPEEVPF